MKFLNYFALAIVLIFSGCNNDEDPSVNETGTFTLKLDNFVGTTDMQIVDAGSTDYMFTTTDGEPFNITTFRYYISKIKLEGSNGELHEDEINVSPNANEVKGFYLINESEASSQYITLKNIPAGRYNKISFTVGIGEEGIEEGAAGGILDPAAGAWFWNWNAGYIGFAIEGGAENSPQERVEGEGFLIEENSFGFHVGGWKDVTPSADETQKFVNNLKDITLDLDANIRVGEGLDPQAHIIIDALKVLDGANIDFSTTYAIHSPKAGEPLANQLVGAFFIDHTHQ